MFFFQLLVLVRDPLGDASNDLRKRHVQGQDPQQDHDKQELHVDGQQDEERVRP